MQEIAVNPENYDLRTAFRILRKNSSTDITIGDGHYPCIRMRPLNLGQNLYLGLQTRPHSYAKHSDFRYGVLVPQNIPVALDLEKLLFRTLKIHLGYERINRHHGLLYIGLPNGFKAAQPWRN